MTYHTLVDVTALAALVEQNGALICDCRFDLADTAAGRLGYLGGHIPGAVYIDLERDLSAASNGNNGRHPLPERTEFAARMAGLGLRPGMQVVSYDTSGGFYAARLWWMLRWIGHQEVAVLDGGLHGWADAGLSLASGEQPLDPSSQVAMTPEPGMAAVEVTAIEANLAGGDLLVVDARTAERFAGAPHPLDTVSGHIPGAINRFYQLNLAADGRFKPASELAQEFAALLGETPPDKVVHQCGSGVTATHNLLAMEVAGLRGSALYPGSWSEWVSRPERPIAVGPA